MNCQNYRHFRLLPGLTVTGIPFISRMRIFLLCLSAMGFAAPASAQTRSSQSATLQLVPPTPAGNRSSSTPPALSAIRQQDIKNDIYAMAGDHFRGREAGTLDELKVAVWLADKAKAAGLKPGGDDGTYFQYFSMWRNRISAASTVTIEDHSLALWSDVLIPQTATATVDAPLLFIDRGDTNRSDIKGKAIVMAASSDGLNLQVSLPLRRYLSLVTRKYASGLLAKGAAAVIFITDSLAEAGWVVNASYADHGTYSIEG